jgi:hypothetical protein
MTGYQAGAVRALAGGGILVVLGILLGVAAVAMAGSGERRFGFLGLVVVVLVSTGSVGLGVGVGALLRARRWRHALARTPWTRGRLRIAGPAIIAFEPQGYDEFVDEPVRLRLLSTAIWRIRALQALHDGEIRAAPVGGDQWVLTAEPLETL